MNICFIFAASFTTNTLYKYGSNQAFYFFISIIHYSYYFWTGGKEELNCSLCTYTGLLQNLKNPVLRTEEGGLKYLKSVVICPPTSIHTLSIWMVSILCGPLQALGSEKHLLHLVQLYGCMAYAAAWTIRAVAVEVTLSGRTCQRRLQPGLNFFEKINGCFFVIDHWPGRDRTTWACSLGPWGRWTASRLRNPRCRKTLRLLPAALFTFLVDTDSGSSLFMNFCAPKVVKWATVLHTTENLVSVDPPKFCLLKAMKNTIKLLSAKANLQPQEAP